MTGMSNWKSQIGGDVKAVEENGHLLSKSISDNSVGREAPGFCQVLLNIVRNNKLNKLRK